MRTNLPPVPEWEPTEPDRDVKNAMDAVAAAHREFTRAAPDETFDRARSTAGSNYNLHHLDMETTGEAEDAFAADVAARLRRLPRPDRPLPPPFNPPRPDPAHSESGLSPTQGQEMP